jgi:hypothetical protein
MPSRAHRRDPLRDILMGYAVLANTVYTREMKA